MDQQAPEVPGHLTVRCTANNAPGWRCRQPSSPPPGIDSAARACCNPRISALWFFVRGSLAAH